MFRKTLNLLLTPIISIRDRFIERKLKNISEKNRFTLFYKSGYWRSTSKESFSGAGSSIQATEEIRRELSIFLKKYNIKSILDVPCGDWYWMKEVDLQGINYIGGDIVDDIVELNNLNYLSNTVKFKVIDIVNDPLPKSDLIFVRDCFVHLKDDDIILALKNIVKSGSKYLATTTFPNSINNKSDVNKDRWREIDLTKSPFFLTKEIELLSDMHSDSIDREKYIGIWRIDDLFIKSSL